MKTILQSDLSDLYDRALMDVGEGNPGALDVCTRVNLPVLVKIHELDIRGSDIWMLYKDECGEKIALFTQAIETKHKLAKSKGTLKVGIFGTILKNINP